MPRPTACFAPSSTRRFSPAGSRPRPISPSEPALNIAHAAHALGFSINLNVVREVDDTDLTALVLPFAGIESVRQRFYDVQPVGRARAFPGHSLRSDDSGFCAAAAVPTVTDDRRVIACNGPAYFSQRTSPLVLGSLDERPLHALLRAHRDDPVLETIRTFGPSRLRQELRTIPGFEDFPIRDRYGGLCDLCLHITSNPAAVEALRNRLAEPRLTAEREAARKVIAGEKERGSLAWHEVNGPASRRLIFAAARDGRGDREGAAESILSRPDLDWSRLAAYVTKCGLARILLRALDTPPFSKWAPSFFAERVGRAATSESLRLLVQRAGLLQVANALADLGARGVLLKGTAFVLDSPEAIPMRRATGDLDVLVRPEVAPQLRSRLMADGWVGDAHAAGAPHHLAPLYFQGVPLEIHTRIIRGYWGFPETDMLRFRRAVPGVDALSVLDPTGFLLHAAVHASTSIFSLGLKTAWDFHVTLSADEPVDWERLAVWIKATRMPRAFWAPARELDRALSLGLPAAFLSEGPADERQQRLEIIARRRLFASTEHPDQMNRWTKNAVLLMMHDSNLSRARFLVELFDRSSRAARTARREIDRRGEIGDLTAEVRDACATFLRYRRATAARASRS